VSPATTHIAAVTGPSSLLGLSLAVGEAGRAPRQLRVLMVAPEGGDPELAAITGDLCKLLLPEAAFAPWPGGPVLPRRMAEGLKGQSVRLWLCRFNQIIEHRLLAAFPDAPVSGFDEGIGSFVPEEVGAPVHTMPDQPLNTVTRVPRNLLDRLEVFHRQFDIPLPEHLADVEVRTVSRDALLRGLARIEAAHPADLAPGAAVHLVLGTCFSNAAERLSREAESAHYARVVRRLLRDGCRVVWVRHPRLLSDFAADPGWLDLVGQPGFSALTAQRGLPVERLGLRHEIACSYSIGSSAQIALGELFGAASRITTDASVAHVRELWPAVGYLSGKFPDQDTLAET